MPIFSPNKHNLQRAANLIQNGELVAFPTETVYGLGANALDAQAVQKIFNAKGRPSYNPLIVHVLDIDAARELVLDWPRNAQLLAEHFWPGALTFVLPKRGTVPDIVTAGLASVAVRSPSHPVARVLLQAAQRPIAAPSANKFTQTSPTRAEHVISSLGDSLMVLEGVCDVGIESTVLDLTRDVPVLLRPGTISREDIENVVGAIKLRGEIEYSNSSTAPRPSPGLIERHYAPRATLQIFYSSEELTQEEYGGDGWLSGALLLSSFTDLRNRFDFPIQMPNDAPAYARELYAYLHALDDAGCSVVFVEDVPPDCAWDGVRDRLQRASTPLKTS
ncbi:MAG TPA: L-threonylcarbamoyladenylate synthase [Abditibacteriaceae bacterium]|nr:L-threonylcarbamoyladenylate synthase [Abditibacteriaceae bacterium]